MTNLAIYRFGAFLRVQLAHGTGVGIDKPRDDSHAFMRSAVSTCLIFLTNASLSKPPGSFATSRSSRSFSTASWSSKRCGFDRWRMADGTFTGYDRQTRVRRCPRKAA
jgi:hypothetical protein